MKLLALQSPRPNTGRSGVLVCAAATLIMNCASAACPTSLDTSTGADGGSPTRLDDHVIRNIRIANGDVFDLEEPEHDRFVHHLMNAIHIQTHEDVIRRQLLFAEGEFFDQSSIAETERYLRANRYLAEADVSGTNCEDGYIDLQVNTTDAWSLIPSISFSRKGGQNFGGFEIQETNLFGSGSELKLAYDSDIDRDSFGVRYADRQLGDSRTGILIALDDYVDGYRYRFDLGQPFYSLDTNKAAGFKMDVFDQLDGIYELGERVADVRHDAKQFAVQIGRSRGINNGRVVRWSTGIGYDEHHFLAVDDYPITGFVPADRRDVYPFVRVEWLQNIYEKVRNQDQMFRVEDRHLGTSIAMQLGYASTLLGSSGNALRLEAAVSRGFRPAAGDSLMLQARLDWREPRDGRSSYLIQGSSRYYHQQSEKRLFFAQLKVAAGENLDTDKTLYLGGDTGLRGYPVRYLTGDTSVLLTLEQRYYFDWYPFGLFRVGAAAFFDAGKVSGMPENEATPTTALKNAGVGLRIGSPHSATGRMLHIDAAYAMDGPQEIRGWQLYIESRTRF